MHSFNNLHYNRETGRLGRIYPYFQAKSLEIPHPLSFSPFPHSSIYNTIQPAPHSPLSYHTLPNPP